MRPSAWPRRHPLHRHAIRPPVDGNHHRRYRKDRERTLDDKGNPTGQHIRRDDPTDPTEHIKTLYAMGKPTEEETKQPPDPAAANTNQDAKPPDMSERVDALETRITAVEEHVGKLEAGGVEQVEPEEPADERPE